MATTAVLYDIHGNWAALEAVLEDALEAGADAFVLGGDYALFGPSPAETVTRLRELHGAIWIRGNVDRWSAFPDEAGDDALLQGAIADCRAELGAVAGELGALPEQTVLDGTLYCHASPLSDLRSFLPEPGDEDDELLAGAAEERICFGHTHLQFRRARPDGIELVNPGSVGMPFDGDRRAAYALVHGDGTLELRRVAYDVEMAVAVLQQRFGDAPWATRSVKRLRSAGL